MTKYRAKNDVPPGIKAGDVVEFKDPLVDGYKNHFTEVGDDVEVSHTAGDNLDPLKTALVNPSVEEMRAKCDEYGIEYNENATAIELTQLLNAAEMKNNDGGHGGGNSTPDRAALKARATELNIQFASNTPTDKLVELIAEAEAKS